MEEKKGDFLSKKKKEINLYETSRGLVMKLNCFVNYYALLLTFVAIAKVMMEDHIRPQDKESRFPCEESNG